MKLRGDHNRCMACGEYFNSTKAFEKHRTSAYEPLDRRCLTPVAMAAKGMSKNTSGYWVTRAFGDALSDRYRDSVGGDLPVRLH